MRPARPLLRHGSRGVRSRRHRERSRGRRRHRSGRPRREGAAGRGQLPRAGHRGRGGILMGHHEPVADWATDFDHTDDVWAADPYPIWHDLRQQCPVAHSCRYAGAWLPARFEDVASIAYDTERFTSLSVVVSEFRPPVELAPAGIAPPISSDPPFHKD